MNDLKLNDVVKVKGTKETYELGIQHRVGKVIRLRGDGELVDLLLHFGQVVKLSSDEVVPASQRELERYAASGIL